MATLADAGQQQTNENNPFDYRGTPAISENNPYQQALQGGAAAKTFAQVPTNPNKGTNPNPGGAVPSYSGPAASGYEGPVSSGELGNLASADTVASSVADTPEAMSPQQAASQESSALKTIDANQSEAYQYVASGGKKGKNPVKPPTEQQDINAALAPDQAGLAALAPEFKSTLSQLAPYLGSGNDTGNAALNAADATVANAVGSSDNIVEAALNQLPKDSKEYAKSVSTQPIVQALLGFGKYEETYAGAQPTGQSNWSSQMQEIYQYLSGNNASNDGLGSPQAAASAAQTSAVPSDTGAGGGNG